MRFFQRSVTALIAGISLINTVTSFPMNTAAEKSVPYDNGAKQISYLAQGPSDGPLVILLHGWPALAETWRPQLDYLSSQGFYTIAPDMPGYGKSTARSNLEDYAHENIIPGLLALLHSTGRNKAVWIGHDWGAAVASSLVATHPEVVEAMAWLAVPYKTIELGYVEVLPLVNRTIYPADQYPYGQWEYMRYYEEAYDRVTAVFNSGIEFSVRSIYTSSNGNESLVGTRSPLSEVRRNGGWFGGVDKVPSADVIPLNSTILSENLYNVLVDRFTVTGYGPADAYYMNHARNRAYNLQNQKNGGYLDDIPCLFIEAKYDTVCDTVTSDLLSPMPKHCKNFAFASVEAGHWLALESPQKTNEALGKWMAQNVTSQWEGKWGSWRI